MVNIISVNSLLAIYTKFTKKSITQFNFKMMDHSVQKIGDKANEFWAISGIVAPICEKGELNIYNNQNIKNTEEILTARCAAKKSLMSMSSLMHEDFCSVKDTASDCDSGAQSGQTDSTSCANENCRKESMKSINSINTRPQTHYLYFILFKTL